MQACRKDTALKDKKVSIDLTYPLPEIERMIEIAPEIISTFEPAAMTEKTKGISSFSETILSLRWGLNAIRTYFQKSGKKFWQPRHQYSPTIRTRAPEGTK